MPDISTINSVDIATIASFNGVALADGQTLEGQNIALGAADAHEFISTTGTITTGTSTVEISGFDSTYDIYELHFINIKAPSPNTYFRFIAKNGSTNLANTQSEFQAFHAENTSSGSIYTDSGNTNSVAYVKFSGYMGLTPNSDESGNAILRLYSPSNTTYGKLFESVATAYHYNNAIAHTFSQGIWNTTSAITSIVFYLYDDIADGEIRLYGIATS